jgi:hypothetical protein
MQQSKPYTDAERPDDNPYAPPKAETSTSVDEGKTNEVARRRRTHLCRETCIRITGLLSFVMTVIGTLVCGLGTIFALQWFHSSDEEGVEAWTNQEWLSL